MRFKGQSGLSPRGAVGPPAAGRTKGGGVLGESEGMARAVRRPGRAWEACDPRGKEELPRGGGGGGRGPRGGQEFRGGWKIGKIVPGATVVTSDEEARRRAR